MHEPTVDELGRAEPEVESDGDRSGTDLADGKYTLVELLGSGGMGKVYRARHNVIGKDVAIKVLAKRFAEDPIQAGRFVQEARAASAIAHDNVIDVIDFGTTPDGTAFMTMEKLEGEPLSDTLDREAPLGWTRTKRIILQVCRALHAAHSHGVIHRDVKPDNCFRIKRGANGDFIKVLDFGLAKVTGDELKPEQSLTVSGTVFGTPEYMSPEQARGLKADARTDVYAVGVMLYEMITGTAPFSAKTSLAMLTKHASERPQPPRLRAPDADISPELEAIILKALAKDPDDRFASMRDMAEAIAALPVEGGPRASGSFPAATPPPGRSRDRTLAIAFGLVSLALAIALAFALAGRS